MKRSADDRVLEEEVEGPPEKLPLIETWKDAYPTRIYPEPYEATSKTLKCEIKARRENWFIPSEIQLYLNVKPLTDTFLLIDYKSMGKEEDLKLKSLFHARIAF